MNAQEALAQAVQSRSADMCEPECDTCARYAAAILDALPEGWVLVNGHEGMLNSMHRCGVEDGAQQERERLRERNKSASAKHPEEHRHRVYHYGHVLLADPEDET